MRKKPNWWYFSDLICCRNVLKTQFEEKWAKANTLEYTTTNRYKWSAKFICKNRGFEVSVKTFHQWFDMIGNVVVINIIIIKETLFGMCFECTIVNLVMYRQFTNAAWDWIIIIIIIIIIITKIIIIIFCRLLCNCDYKF